MTARLLLRGIVLGMAVACSASACTDPAPMAAQRRYRAWGENEFFLDDRAMRPLPAHVVPREWPVVPDLLLTGRQDGAYLREIPVPVDRLLLERGEHQFNIYCATCHGLLGDGDSMVARNMPLRKPPSLIEHEPHGPNVVPAGPTTGGLAAGLHPHFLPGYVFQVITEGYGFMPGYANELPIEERWAVIAYLEALRLSQTAQLSQLPPEVRAHFEGGGR